MNNIKIEKNKIPEACFEIANLLKNIGKDSYLVGGCVRDMLLGKDPKDFDICTNASTDQIKSALANKGIYFTTVGEQYGTIVAHMNEEEYEITTFRRETGYSDGRHPDKVEKSDKLYDDLKRRDFTINAMAYSLLDDALHDPFNGYCHLKEKVLICVGDPWERFAEDGLRILRAVRFAAKYDLKIEYNTYRAMKDHIDIVDYVSKERITSELRKMFESDCKLSEVFDECNFVISRIIPEIKPEIGCSQKNKSHHQDVWHHSLSVLDGISGTENKFVVKLSALLHDIGKPVCKTVDENGFEHFYGHPEKSYEIAKQIIENDLVLTCKEKDAVLNLVRYHDEILIPTEKSVNKFVVKHGTDLFFDFLSLKQSDLDDHVFPDPLPSNIWDGFLFNKNDVKNIFNSLMEKESCFGLRNLAVNGNDLLSLGIKKGPEIGKILNSLLDGVCEGQYQNNKESLLDIVKQTITFEKDSIEEDMEF